MKRKNTSAVVLGLAWLASLGAVFILGILSAFAFHLEPGAGAAVNGDLDLDQRDLVLTIERYAGAPVDMAALFAGTRENEIPDQLDQTIRAILRERDPVLRDLGCLRLVRGLPPRLITGSIRLLQEIPAGPARDQALGHFLQGWARNDGRSAIAYATSVPSFRERQFALEAVLRGWSEARPPEAWNWVIEREGSSRRAERWLEVILASLGKTDRETALRLLESLPSAQFQARMSRVVMEQLLRVEPPREALDWLAEFPEAARSGVAATLAGDWAQTEPRAAAAWFRDAFPEEVDALGDVLAGWAYEDAGAAADWVWERFEGSARSRLMDLIAGEWIANDGPTPVAEWLNARGPHPHLDGAIEALSLATAEMNPATALVWAQSVTDPETSSMLEIYIGRDWLRTDPQEAEETLPLLLESEAARSALLEPVYESVEDSAVDTGSVPRGGAIPPPQ